MNNNLMVLPATDPKNIRLVRIPSDFEEHEAYRYVTGLIAKAEQSSDYDWDDISDLLEEKDFEIVEFTLGPLLD
ncbi:MAG: hypothetical protein OQK75_02925 [Gammaproteobacteria bacterium]|nr:hypothetical protein [Gammaproteobacteria bacterium]MCW8986602.1 hypothetical protein [Gammaproteobacteria bacterium]MCW9029962.1 hypothetical protein [Gammaproteobacteria bacterium]